MKILLDIEANGLRPDKIWVIVTKEIDSGDVNIFSGSDVYNFNNFLSDNDVTEIVAHNGIGFDFPVLERLLGTDLTNIKLTDTLVLSRLANPQREGGHGLKEWGIRLGDYKGDYDDWSKLTQEMVDYCVQDVEVLDKV